MQYFFSNIKNNIDFWIRQHLVFSRKNYNVKNEPKDGLLSSKELIEREKVLVEKFDLGYLQSNSTRENYLQNLYTIDLLDKYLTLDYQDNIKVLDIGCKNWFYAKGEYSFFKKHCKNLEMDGVEIDVNRLYSNFYTRFEVAKFYTQNLEGIKYIADDFLNINDKYNHIVWILPFVVEYPHVKWGLPKKIFNPEKMLMHAYNSLMDGGSMFIINQGEAEFKIQKALCEKLHIQYTELGEVESDFFDYKYKRYALLIKK